MFPVPSEHSSLYLGSPLFSLAEETHILSFFYFFLFPTKQAAFITVLQKHFGNSLQYTQLEGEDQKLQRNTAVD